MRNIAFQSTRCALKGKGSRMEGTMPQPVNYDRIAAEYDQRYAALEFGGIEKAVVAFAAGTPGLDTLEVGCGTGMFRFAKKGQEDLQFWRSELRKED